MTDTMAKFLIGIFMVYITVALIFVVGLLTSLALYASGVCR